MQIIYQSIVTLLEMHRRYAINGQENFAASWISCNVFYLGKLEALEVLGLVQRTGELRFTLTEVGVVVAENLVRTSLESVLGDSR